MEEEILESVASLNSGTSDTALIVVPSGGKITSSRDIHRVPWSLLRWKICRFHYCLVQKNLGLFGEA